MFKQLILADRTSALNDKHNFRLMSQCFDLRDDDDVSTKSIDKKIVFNIFISPYSFTFARVQSFLLLNFAFHRLVYHLVRG